jgi:hypothetical protein
VTVLYENQLNHCELIIIIIIIIIKPSVLTQYCAGDKIEKNEMGGTSSSDWGGEWRVQGFGWET